MAETELEKRVREAEKGLCELALEVRNHVESCDKRGKRGEKIQLVILAGVLSICAGLAPVVFKLLVHHV